MVHPSDGWERDLNRTALCPTDHFVPSAWFNTSHVRFKADAIITAKKAFRSEVGQTPKVGYITQTKGATLHSDEELGRVLGPDDSPNHG